MSVVTKPLLIHSGSYHYIIAFYDAAYMLNGDGKRNVNSDENIPDDPV